MIHLASTSESSVFDSDRINTVITTQHHLHAPQVMRALEKNKNVFVEKPLAIDLDELEKSKRFMIRLKAKSHMLWLGLIAVFHSHIGNIKKSSQPINGA